MALVHWLPSAKHALGTLLLVPYWPSRRYMRRLNQENAELLRSERELRRVVTVAQASADTVLQTASAAWRRNRL